MWKQIDAAAAKNRIFLPDEYAFVDVREAGEFGEGQALFSINIPYSRLELEFQRRQIRQAVPIVLIDAGDGIAEKAARRLEDLHFSDISIVEGGIGAWEMAGFNLFKGVHVPSKAFGELVEIENGTPHISAQQLQDLKQSGEGFVILDGRTPEEYRKMTIPGARCCPNAELGHRLPQIVDDSSTKIVVNCAGRTRSIIGAQSLIHMGLENPIVALENGTQGWQLAGLDLEFGTDPQPFSEFSASQIELSRNQGAKLRQKFSIPATDLQELESWLSEKDRTTYLFDVRTTAEFTDGHYQPAIHAPGGQLVQATDNWMTVRGARTVLIDDTGLRASATAMWLQQMGHDVYVCTLDENKVEADAWTGGAPVSGADQGKGGAYIPDSLPEVSADELVRLVGDGIQIIDLRSSMDFRACHLEGAQWSIRPKISQSKIDLDGDILLISETKSIAELAAIDLLSQGARKIVTSQTGPSQWKQAGLTMTSSENNPSDEEAIDYLFFVHDRHKGNLAAAQAYLDWETGLVEQLDAQERSVFQIKTT